jgi:hypothetical protein
MVDFTEMDARFLDKYMGEENSRGYREHHGKITTPENTGAAA